MDCGEGSICCGCGDWSGWRIMCCGWGVEPRRPCAPIIAAARCELDAGEWEAKEEGAWEGKEEWDPCQLVGPPVCGAT